MILTVPLQVGTLLANVRYKWIATGVEGLAQSSGVTQPDATYPIFRIDSVPPTGAEELVVYDNSDPTNWNVGGYRVAAISTAIAAGGANISPDLQKLKTICAAYLHCAESAFTSNTVDLFLMAVNNARRQAELAHDFEYARVVGTIDLVAAGVDLGSVTIVEGVATAGLKAINAVRRLGTNGYFYPLDFTREDIALERDRSELELRDDYWVTRRYPSDADVLNFYGTNTAIVQRGNKLFLYPGFSGLDPAVATVYVDGFGWLPNYGSVGLVTQPEDFIVKYGFAYLQWATICELNMMRMLFVDKQDGNLGERSLLQKKADAFRELILWDSYITDTAVTRSA